MILSSLDKRRSIGLTEAAELLGIAALTRREPCAAMRLKALSLARFGSGIEGRAGAFGSICSNPGLSDREMEKGMDDRGDATLTISAGASPLRPLAHS
jgi:hypothetical protein